MFNFFKSKKEKEIQKLTSHWAGLFNIIESYSANLEFEVVIKTELHMQHSVHNTSNPDFIELYDSVGSEDFYDTWSVRFNGILLQALILKCCVKDKLEHYLPQLLRKREMLITKDDYGDYNFEKWLNELHNFYKNKLNVDIYNWCRKNEKITRLDTSFDILYLSSDPDKCMVYIIDEYLNLYNYEVDDEYSDNMSGLDYEQYICNLFKNEGFDSYVTKSTGDHGVDVISNYGDLKIAIQCKRYASKVGNKAVQEIYTAKDIFDCNIAVVITNNEFTTSAKEAAMKLNVFLLNHEDITSFCEYIKPE